MQDKSALSSIFLHRTDTLASQLGRNVQELPELLGISRRTLFAGRSDNSVVTAKTWAKLRAAERKFSDSRWEDTVQIEVDRQEAAETKRKDLSELLVKALEMAQEENTELRARVAELEGELAAARLALE